MIWRQCPLCGRDDAILQAREWGFHVVRCRHCALVYVNPIPSEEELREFYESGALPQCAGFDLDDSWHRGYALKRGHYFSAVDSRQNTASRLAAYSKTLALLKTLRSSGDLLDVGCGRGDFMLAAESLGYQTCGVEVSVSGAQEARKRGLLRLEGKNYIVQDGDVITFLFNV